MRDLFVGVWKFLIRITAFVRREIFSFVRQPQLFLTLVLGPFLILLVFGIGFHNKARPLRTLFIASNGSQLREQIEEMAPTLGPQLIYLGVEQDISFALEKLRRGEIDVVATAPENASQDIQSGNQAEFNIYHREIDPLQEDYVRLFAQTYIEEVNHRILRDITQLGQSEAENLKDQLVSAQESSEATLKALETGDELAARYSLSTLALTLNDVLLGVGFSLGLFGNLEQSVSDEDIDSIAEIDQVIERVHELSRQIQISDFSEDNQIAWTEEVLSIRSNLDELQSRLDTFTSLDPDVLISPFAGNTVNFSEVQPDSTNFFAPAVMTLLIQHLAVTIASLSTVQERNYGTMELFRVSPLTAGEILLGKYLSYLSFTTIVAILLGGLLHFVLELPMLGRWQEYITVLFALMFTSLGIGFIISLIARNDSQAVQYTMIVLLISVFFSGFIMDRNYFVEAVKWFSWSIPTTYGIEMLRDISLRGNSLNILLISTLTLMGVMGFVVSWILLKKQMASR